MNTYKVKVTFEVEVMAVDLVQADYIVRDTMDTMAREELPLFPMDTVEWVIS